MSCFRTGTAGETCFIKKCRTAKEIIEFWQHIFLDEGYAAIQATQDVRSLLQIVVELEDSNGKVYRQGVRMYEGTQEAFVYPKYGADIRRDPIQYAG